MNWNIFNLKYERRETWAFEQLSYLLFCTEFNNKIGLFRYKNQAGIETEYFTKDARNYGFQAKYYTTSLSQNKDNIIDSLKKAKRKNPELNSVYLYVNQELSESSKPNQKKPQYQLEIEKVAKDLELEIEWRVPSNLELQLALPENKYIYDLFFNLHHNQENVILDIESHNDNLLRSISSEITFENQHIKVDRNYFQSQIIEALDHDKSIIISGEGGSGKTAILKEFYENNKQKIPICIFKASELNVMNVNDLFNLDHHFSFIDFLQAYELEEKKIFIIDSAEKMAELTRSDLLTHLINTLSSNGWFLVFTTRFSYLNDLSFHIKESYQLPFQVFNVPLLTTDELEKLSQEYHFSLPDNFNFSHRLHNLFYLNEYLRHYTNIDKKGNFENFIDILWKKKIQNNNVQKDNVHLERDKCFIELTKERCKTGLFYINTNNLSPVALSLLKQDEILGYSEIHDGYFITHDIYEEWALNRIISRRYANYEDVDVFFEDIGSSLPVRRAFRLWLSEQLFYYENTIENFVLEIFKNPNVNQYWKDELLVSVLLSDYSQTFFTFFEKEIVANDFELLRKIIFIIRTACSDISTNKGFDIIIPKGKGWEVLISFIYRHKKDFFEQNLKLVVPLLKPWCLNNPQGETTKISGLLALSIIQKTEHEKNFYIHGEAEEELVKIIFNAAEELVVELKEIFEKVILNQWTAYNDPYEGICSKILEKPYLAFRLIRALPESVIGLCNLFWRKKIDDDYDNYSVESKYDLTDKHRFNYHPASAYQTPTYLLLGGAFKETLEFIIDFTNKSTKSYRHSNYGDDIEEVIVHIDDKEIKQYLCWAFWGAYRGISSPVVPYLLQSMHMALEKKLLELAQDLDASIIEVILLQIIAKTESTSLTAVVSSIVLAYPDKLYNVAIVLFKTLEFFGIDMHRCVNEFQTKSLYSIGNGLMDTYYTDERLKTCEDKHRGTYLESLLVNYQFFGVKGFTKDQNERYIAKLYEIIDSHKKAVAFLSGDSKITAEILLSRADRRIMKPEMKKINETEYHIELNPQLPPDLKEHSEQAVKQYEDIYKYIPLKMWSDFIFRKRNSGQNQNYPQYDENPVRALKEAKQLLNDLSSNVHLLPLDSYTPYFVCANLMINHRDKLSEDDKLYCKELILLSISRLFEDEYHYHISDGVEAALHAIPSLMEEYPDEKENFISLMIFSLFDDTSLGNARICDYVINTIYESGLWDKDFGTVNNILLGFIKLKPIFKEICDNQKQDNIFVRRIQKKQIFQKLREALGDFSLSNILYDIRDIDLLDIFDLEIVYQLIPTTTNDQRHLEIIKRSLPTIIPQLLEDKKESKQGRSSSHSNIYLVRLYIFRKLANLILEQGLSEIDLLLKPFVEQFTISKEMAAFLDEVVGAADKNDRQEQFWYVWNQFYPRVIAIGIIKDNSYVHEILKSYLLAWDWWREDAKQWHSLRKENLRFYDDIIRDLGSNPSILYCISKVLNSIASQFGTEGIDWLYRIISNNTVLQLRNLEVKTLQYLEKFLRTFIFQNRQKIKKGARLKNKVIIILDFVIERGSVHGYLLRESIL
ncbi:MAG: ATP-binding protein [Candidatus Chryseobacterium colombiense]|nr:AVAST type 4 anti-phage nuclease Avs4 [Chryseobacterium sp.]WEK70272.1 MAG: ATP-binding protein [Chryseobacterium sp.]